MVNAVAEGYELVDHGCSCTGHGVIGLVKVKNGRLGVPIGGAFPLREDCAF